MVKGKRMSHDLGWRCPICKRWWSQGADVCEICSETAPQSTESAPNSSVAVLPLSMYQPTKIKVGKKNKWAFRNMIFDSRVEAIRYGYLADLQSAGVIRHLFVQPTCVLRPAFTLHSAYAPRKDGSARTIPQETYTPDYAYLYNGMMVIEDVKGIKTVTRKVDGTETKIQIPYSKTNSDRSQRHLMYKYRNKTHVLFMLVAMHRKTWRYWQASYGYPELTFELVAQVKDKAA